MRVKGRGRIFTTVDLSAAYDMVDYTLLIDVANYIVITMLIILISMGIASIDLSLEECLMHCTPSYIVSLKEAFSPASGVGPKEKISYNLR